ncbi:hypothetical protein CNR27_10710 [Luteimonas chenhongjianii]|uniref:Uncharacterized protein n=1 Tax=Luteimonas chenhongjianii TaxID=2006110 RepID=A0A290XFI2_9GAMM|nr:hypothetical protein [Luteimonas chenhongjianii]ATD67839.1 hypothetical protein CNR27_10710 [Luteimonas chenhongjianii]
MNRPDREPLTDEERLQAERPGAEGHGPSPSPGLGPLLADGREVAAEASSTDTAIGARARRRLPWAMGIATSLALALGIAWQLRPAPATVAPRALPEISGAAPASKASPAPRGQRDAARSPRAPAPPAAPAPASQHRTFAIPGEVPAAGDRNAQAAQARAPAAPRLDGTALGADVSSAPASASVATALLALTSLPATPLPSAAAPVAAPGDAPARILLTAVDTGPRASSTAWVDMIDDVPEDSDPPATADAPEVRAAWLVRVRELLDAGRIAEARASLVEFHRRHPQSELPPDLRALLE